MRARSANLQIRRLATLGGLALALGIAAGCGLPVDASPVPIPSSSIPLALTTPNSTLPIVNPRVGVPISIYLIAPDGDQLIKVTRYVRYPLDPQKILDALEEGPTDTEIAEDITSALPPTANLLSDGIDQDGILRITLDPSFRSLLTTQDAFYFAQIVWTMVNSDDLPEVGGVAFEYDNAFVEPEIGNGSQWTQYVVTRRQYEEMAPQSS